MRQVNVLTGPRSVLLATTLVALLAGCSEITSPSTAAPAFALVPSASNVTYCTQDGVALKMDVYHPAASTPEPRPALVFIHGGAWMGGDKQGSSVGNYDIQKLKNRGWTVFSINYTVGVSSWPEFLEDSKCSIRHIRANAATYRINPDRIGVFGHSAGGHIAAMVGVTPSGLYEGDGGYPGVSSRVQAVVTYAGPFDLTRLQDFGNGSAQHVQEVFGDSAFVASPINYASSDDPPFLIYHGTLDESIAIAQPQLFVPVLQAAGVPVTFTTIINGGHYLLPPSNCGGCVATPGRLQITNAVDAFFGGIIR